ncbi:hypothetical protein JCM8097_007444, partial [Rhodosporidiobolus ruineniae]
PRQPLISSKGKLVPTINLYSDGCTPYAFPCHTWATKRRHPYRARFSLSVLSPLLTLSLSPQKTIKKLGGQDLTPGSRSTNTSTLISNVAQYHDFRAYSTDSGPDWYYGTMVYLRYSSRKGFMATRMARSRRRRARRATTWPFSTARFTTCPTTS